jgi:hypothetical protein
VRARAVSCENSREHVCRRPVSFRLSSSRSLAVSLAVQQGSELLCRCALLRRQHVRVGLHRLARIVAEPCSHDVDRLSGTQHQRGRRMAQTMKRDRTDLCGFDESRKFATCDVLLRQRQPEQRIGACDIIRLSGEDEIEVRGVVEPMSELDRGLLLLVRAQQRDRLNEWFQTSLKTIQPWG